MAKAADAACVQRFDDSAAALSSASSPHLRTAFSHLHLPNLFLCCPAELGGRLAAPTAHHAVSPLAIRCCCFLPCSTWRPTALPSPCSPRFLTPRQKFDLLPALQRLKANAQSLLSHQPRAGTAALQGKQVIDRASEVAVHVSGPVMQPGRC